FCASDAADASKEKPVILEVSGEIPVGIGEAAGLVPGKALSVMTGSYIPDGDYAVVRRFDVQREGNNISLTRPIKMHENMEIQGETRKKGSTLFRKGDRITSDDIFLLASQGILELKVAKSPRVALFSSGDEVIPPTAPLRIGAIWDCNSYGLSSLIQEAGGISLFRGIVRDDFDRFVKEVRTALQEADMVVISGGTAVGGRDFTVALLNAVGSPGALVKGIPMRSGKPIVLGVAGPKPIVCVAGHPPEAARGFSLFGRPAISHLMGEID
ncbi:MAG: molybdopterin molybdotransferase MoeA, partial [Nitrospiria bacterium]